VVNQVDWNASLQHEAVSATVSSDGASIVLRVSRGATSLIERIDLGVTVDGVQLAAGSHLARAVESQIDEKWFAHSGKSVGDHSVIHSELLVELVHAPSARVWTIRVRLAADGVAVRYSIPDLQGVGALTEDGTALDLSDFERAWVLDYQTWYETPRSGVDLADLADGNYGFPFLARRGDNYILVTESGIDGRYSGAHPVLTAPSLGFALADSAIEIARGDVTPWRVFIFGALSDVVESLFVDELAPAVRSEVSDFSWVRPGRAAWSWWSDFYSGAQLEQQKRFVDAAAELSWEHLLIDCGWEETWVPEIVAYASLRGIQVHLWTVWHDLDGPEKLARLALWRSWGVAGIKVDFMESESKDRYRWYDSVLQETARLGLMVNFHGSVIPRGWARTWPHVIGYEAIRGSEYYVFYNDTPLTAAHNVIQPFTRNVVGAMDYTPVAFGAPGRETSDAHELALSVAFESGITHFADDVDAYLDRPLARRFLSEVAPLWDQTVLLSGTPDTEAVVARRSGDRWFIGGIATGEARELTVPLERLGIRDALAWVISDAFDGSGLMDATAPVSETLTVSIAENGGFVAIISTGELHRATPRASSEAPSVTPGTAQLDANLETVLETTPGARLRLAPGWSAVEERAGSWIVRAPRGLAAGQLGVVAVELPGEVPVVAHARVVAPLSAGTHRVSRLPMLAFNNESGPIERDMSNGEGNPRDGNAMRIAGETFDDGLGASTPSTIDLHLGGVRARLVVRVGVDDETQGTRARVEIVGDGVTLASGVIASNEAPLDVDLDVSGIEILRLSTTPVAEGESPAHVDWASARLIVTHTVSDSTTPTPVAVD